MDYADGGDLSDRIKAAGDKLLQEDVIKHIFVQVVLALEVVHQNHMIHRDLKSQNVFLMKDDRVLVGDFGIAKELGATNLASTMVGTPCYLSPEICDNKPYD